MWRMDLAHYNIVLTMRHEVHPLSPKIPLTESRVRRNSLEHFGGWGGGVFHSNEVRFVSGSKLCIHDSPPPTPTRNDWFDESGSLLCVRHITGGDSSAHFNESLIGHA